MLSLDDEDIEALGFGSQYTEYAVAASRIVAYQNRRQAEYRSTPEGRKVQRDYNASPAGKARTARYNVKRRKGRVLLPRPPLSREGARSRQATWAQSEKGKAYIAAYRKTEKWKAIRRAQNRKKTAARELSRIRYRRSEKGRATAALRQLRYAKTEKGKAAQKRATQNAKRKRETK